MSDAMREMTPEELTRHDARMAVERAWESALWYAGHRIEGEHDCFDMNCRGLGREVERFRAAERPEVRESGSGSPDLPDHPVTTRDQQMFDAGVSAERNMTANMAVIDRETATIRFPLDVERLKRMTPEQKEWLRAYLAGENPGEPPAPRGEASWMT